MGSFTNAEKSYKLRVHLSFSLSSHFEICSSDIRAAASSPSYLLHSAQATAFDTRGVKDGRAGVAVPSAALLVWDMISEVKSANWILPFKPKGREGGTAHRRGCHANSNAADVSGMAQKEVCLIPGCSQG